MGQFFARRPSSSQIKQDLVYLEYLSVLGPSLSPLTHLRPTSGGLFPSGDGDGGRLLSREWGLEDDGRSGSWLGISPARVAPFSFHGGAGLWATDPRSCARLPSWPGERLVLSSFAGCPREPLLMGDLRRLADLCCPSFD